MKEILIKVSETLKKYKKKIIIACTVIVLGGVGLSLAGGAFLYNKTKASIKYTEKQCEEVALKQIPGEVVKVEKDVDLEDSTVEYEFKIKDKNNMLKEITVDSTSGAIVDIDYDEFHENEHMDNHKFNDNINNNENKNTNNVNNKEVQPKVNNAI
ncbi:PepSY domain-containing protein [Clostridium sp. B9]|uniref:PepSY domain-containing protein n=1 Tax=Clostridium sp. B9 TaxID=3423224 RepID=UPI003D2ED75F